MWRCCLLLALVASLGCGKREAPSQAPLKVAGAADLANAFQEVGAAFEKKTGERVVFTFGSTGMLAKQIEQGAPFEIFAAANISFVDDVISAGACFADSKALYARGRVVVWAKTAPAPTLAELAESRFVKIAIANPEHAPYGRAAKEALQKAGVWESVVSRLVYGENVQQTLQYAQSGNADAAIVAVSLALQSGGSHTLVGADMHAPLDQALVVCKGSTGQGPAPRATRFAEYVSSPEGRAIMTRYGFVLPGESVAKDAN